MLVVKWLTYTILHDDVSDGDTYAGETDSGSDDHEEARLKATRKSRDLREKLKKISRKKAKLNMSSPDDSSEDDLRKRDKNKTKPEKKPAEETQESSPLQSAQRKPHKTPPTPEQSPPKDEVRKHGKGSRKRARKSSHSPDPPFSPIITAPSKQKRDKEEKEVAAIEEGSNVDPRRKKEHQRKKEQDKKEERSAAVKQEDSLGYGTLKSKSSLKEASNGAVLASTKTARDVEEEVDDFRGSKNTKVRDSVAAEVGMKDSKERVDIPQSPVVSPKSSHSSTHGNIESELSSGEDFKEGETEWSGRSKNYSSSRKQEWSDKGRSGSRRRERSEEGDRDIEKQHAASSPTYSAPHPRTPDYPNEPEPKEGVPRAPLSSEKVVLYEEEEEYSSNRGGGDTSVRKGRKLPRRYQIEAEQGQERREGARYREGKDVRPERRYHPQPPSPSPPPQSYPGHSARKRHYHSPPPPPPEGFERRRRRGGRPYSPGGYQQRRRHSRSPPPPYLGSPPPHRVKSPYGVSPPHRYVHWNLCKVVTVLPGHLSFAASIATSFGGHKGDY